MHDLTFTYAVYLQTSLSDPSNSIAAVDAAKWAGDVLLGSMATIIAIICVAFLGFLMLQGRINWKRAATVILGCFILFGARNMAASFDLRDGRDEDYIASSSPAPAALKPPPNDAYDPYAGASIIR